MKETIRIFPAVLALLLILLRCTSSADDQKRLPDTQGKQLLENWLESNNPADSSYQNQLLTYWDMAESGDSLLPHLLEKYGLSLLKRNQIDSVYHQRLISELNKSAKFPNRHQLLNLAGTQFDYAFLPDSAIHFFDTALDEFAETGKDSVLEMTYMYKGLSLYKKAAYTESLTNLNKALEISAKRPDDPNARTIKSYMANVYMDLGDDEKSSAIYGEIADLLIKEGEFERAIVNLSSLTNIYSRMKDTVRGLEASNRALALADSVNADDYTYFTVYLSRAHIMRKAGKNEVALKLFDMAVERQERLNNPYLVSRVKLFKVELLAIMKRWNEAMTLLQEVEPVAKANNSDPSFLMDVYGQMALVEAGLGNYKDALDHSNAYYKFKDSIDVQNQALSVAKLEKQFEDKEKDLKLQVQTQELETARYEKNSWILFTVLSVIISGFGINLIWTNRKKLLKQKEEQLKEKFHQELIIATENEQSRIAMDLHDGVSSDLLVLKNKLPDTADVDARKYIDEIIQDVRQLTKKLYPVQLTRAGICYASRELIQQLDEATDIFFSYEIDESRNEVLPAEKQLYLFRIIQEALNNAIRHSEAEAVYFEISGKGSSVYVEIRDNGKGFEWKGLEEHDSSSLGVRSMYHRAGIIGASFRIATAPGEGTRIELTV